MLYVFFYNTLIQDLCGFDRKMTELEFENLIGILRMQTPQYFPCHYDDFFGSTYLITRDKQSLYWEKLDDVQSELLHFTEDYFSKLSRNNFSQVSYTLHMLLM